MSGPRKGAGGERIRYRSAGSKRRVLVEQIRLSVILFLTGCTMIALETTLCARIPIPLFGWSAAAPALGLLFSMAVGFLYGEREGGMAGLICGWLSDAISVGASVSGMMVLPLLYFLCGYLSGIIGRRRLAHNLPSFMVFSVFGGGLKCLFTAGLAVWETHTIPPVEWMWRGFAPAWALTVAASAVVYGVVWGERALLEPK